MATVLPGFTFDRRSARYRDTSRGQFVSRRTILNLLEQQINGAEKRLGDIVTAMHEGAMSPAYGQTLLRDELRRVHLQNAALGAGGFDRLSFREYGRAGRSLRDSYSRMTNLTNDLKAGKVTLPQALNRISGYVGEARVNFLAAERDAVRATGRAYEERRTLHARESCPDCERYAAMGWQPLGMLPVPGEGNTRCRSNCRCSLERREVETVQRVTIPAGKVFA